MNEKEVKNIDKNVVRMYTVKDIEAETYSQPYFAMNDVVAVRQFYQMCKQVPDEVKGAMALYCIACLDDDMKVFPNDGSSPIALGKDYYSYMKSHEIEKETKANG